MVKKTISASSSDQSDEMFDEILKGAEEMITEKFNSFVKVAQSYGFVNTELNKDKKKRRSKRSNSHGGYESKDESTPNWRDDYRKSKADWRLVIRDGTKKKVYHLHKHILTSGPRRSMYFVQEASDGQGSKQRAESEILLPKSAAKVVPLLLDFIYFDELDLTSKKAPSLRYLANLFDVQALYSLVSSFIQSDLVALNATTYLLEAESVKDTELMAMASQTAATNFDALHVEDISILPPNLFRNVITNPQLKHSSSELLSELIASYIRAKENEVNDEVFYFVTHAQILPRISPREALWYLSFTCRRFPAVLIDESMGGFHGTLKRRCVVAAASEWKDSVVGPIRSGRTRGNGNEDKLFVEGEKVEDTERWKEYKSVPPDIQIELLEEALLNAATTPSVQFPKQNMNSISRETNSVSLSGSKTMTDIQRDLGQIHSSRGRSSRGSTSRGRSHNQSTSNSRRSTSRKEERNDVKYISREKVPPGVREGTFQNGDKVLWV